MHAVNERGDFRDGCTAVGDGESGGRRCRWTAAAARGRCCPRAPPAELFRRAKSCAGRKQIVHLWLRSDGAYDHAAVAEDEHAALAAGASQRLPATNKAGPVTAVRFSARRVCAVRISRRSQRMRPITRSPRARRWSALERLMHTGLVPATVARAITPRPWSIRAGALSRLPAQRRWGASRSLRRRATCQLVI